MDPSWGHALGMLLAPALGVALLPMTRNSLWVYLLRIPFDRAIKWHKAASRAVIVLTIAHAWLIVKDPGFWPIYPNDRLWILRSHNKVLSGLVGNGAVFGTAAGAIFTAMGVLSLLPVRQYSFELFKWTHLVLYPAGIVLAIIHARMVLPYVVIPLGLWVADYAVRTALGFRIFTATATALPGRITRLDIQTGGRVRISGPAQNVLLLVPSVSYVQWHPFTVTNPPGKPDVLSLVIKAKGPGSFTTRLHDTAQAAAAGATMQVRLEGPYGILGLNLENYSTLVLLAGGTGVTPMASIAAAVLAGSVKAPTRIFFVWSARSALVFDAWMPGLADSMRADPRFDVRLHCTSGGMEKGVLASRPNVTAIMAEAVAAASAQSWGASSVAVCVCGPAMLAKDARVAAAAHGCDLHIESFGVEKDSLLTHSTKRLVNSTRKLAATLSRRLTADQMAAAADDQAGEPDAEELA